MEGPGGDTPGSNAGSTADDDRIALTEFLRDVGDLLQVRRELAQQLQRRNQMFWGFVETLPLLDHGGSERRTAGLTAMTIEAINDLDRLGEEIEELDRYLARAREVQAALVSLRAAIASGDASSDASSGGGDLSRPETHQSED